jgi:hypothetical protein
MKTEAQIRANKRYRERHKEKILTKKREYYLKNKAKLLQKAKKRYLDNKDKIKEQRKAYYLNNKEKFKNHNIQYYLENKDEICAKQREWHNKNKDKVKQYKVNTKEAAKARRKIHYALNKNKIQKQMWFRQKQRMKEDPIYKFKLRCRHFINEAINVYKNNNSMSTEKILGCSLEYFIDWIEKQLPAGKTIQDLGIKKYHIDHIMPLSMAKNCDEAIKLCHYTNLRPLWWEENLAKSNKIEENTKCA